MMATSRSRSGCWTCRLRHKKCDQLSPVCAGCSALGITCQYGDPKPPWMDNGSKQREMAQKVKAEIKRNAARRRNRKLVDSITRAQAGEDSRDSVHVPPFPPPSTTAATSLSELSGDSSATGSGLGAEPAGYDLPHSSPSLSIRTTAPSRLPCELDSDTPASTQRARQILPQLQTETELRLVMCYLDYVFPVLFPFYQPSILQGGRSWLLVLILNQDGLLYTVTSLVSYFFSVVPVTPGPMREPCLSFTWDELQKQTDRAVKTVQRDIQNTAHQGVQCDLIENARLMGSIVQLLHFEATIALKGNWQIHLNAALVVFEQILEFHGTNQASLNISDILDQLGQPIFGPLESSSSPWNADQAAFRFFSALLLVNDIIASTSLENEPRLLKYHPSLLASGPGSSQDATLRLEEFIGCRGWVMISMGQIAALDKWKKDMKRAGMLSVMQLVARGDVLDRSLLKGIAELDLASPMSPQSIEPVGTITALTELHPQLPAELYTCITGIWAFTARAYLLIVLSGWQPSNPEIRDCVSQTIDLFRQLRLQPPRFLRTLAWPLCISGCLAEENQQQVFHEIVSSMGELARFGAIRQAMCIMENVWQNHAQINADTWDLATCLASLGSRVLLT